MASKATLPQTAAIYCRVSTTRQEDEGTSLESQEAACRAHAETLGYTVAAVYREVHSGYDLFGRGQMSALRQNVRRREVGLVITYALDRLARNQFHQGLIYAEAEHAGVPIELVSEKLEDTPEGRLLLSVKSYTAEVEREKIRERTIRGKRTRIEAGKLHNHAAELYGYRRDKEAGVRVVFAPEAAVVQRIFQAVAAEGRAIRGVARELNLEAVPPPSAGKRTYKDGRACRWNPSTIYRILAEPAYKGETFAWRHESRAAGHQWRYRDQSEWIRLPEGTTPAIVSTDVWQAAQARLAATSGPSTRNATRPYLLRGLIFCAICGRRMHSCPEHGRRAYRCSSRDSAAGVCGGKRVPGEAVEAWIWAEVETILRDPSIIAAEVERRRDAGPDEGLKATRDAAARMLSKLEGQRARLVRRYAESDDDAFPWELVEREIARIEAERRTAQAALADIDARLVEQQAAIVQLDELHAYCANVSANLDAADFTIKRNAVEALVERVTANGREWELAGSVPLSSVAGVLSHSSPRCAPRPRPPRGRA